MQIRWNFFQLQLVTNFQSMPRDRLKATTEKGLSGDAQQREETDE
jgi:hypothetical protein